MKYCMPLWLTRDLSEALEKQDWDLLEEIICLYGYDEYDHEKQEYIDGL